ncbi:MAG: hypothetical protein LBJ08_02550 [Bifidobacteriaceae bacterium]|nr:hypothetical protein [Bifidobacteriaceae bacterium]
MTEAEFRDFFEFMHPPLARYARRHLDPDTANDVAVDTLRSVWTKGIEAPRDDVEHRQLLSLSYRICDGLIRNATRAEERRRALVERVTQRSSLDTQAAPDIAEGIVQAAAAEELLKQLSDADREVVALLLDGYKVAEMAVILGCGAPAVTMRLRRAKNHLISAIARDAKEDANAADTRQS